MAARRADHRAVQGTARRGGGPRGTQVRAAERPGAELRGHRPDRARGRRDRPAGRAGQGAWRVPALPLRPGPAEAAAGMNRVLGTPPAAAALPAGVAPCASAPAPPDPQPPPAATVAPSSSAATAAPASVHHAGRRAGTLSVLTEPQAGIGPLYRLVTGARSSVDLTMYELADPAAEADLAADAARGVDVRVILDQNLEKSRNTAAYDYLAARGVHVRWAAAGTTWHQKTLTVDDATSVIMTLNLVTEDYPGTRDFAVIDTNRADVAGRAITPPDGTDLVWSPTNAETSILSVINGATRTLAVENEEMSDPAVTAALASAARRGVHVTITMTADSEWDQALA